MEININEYIDLEGLFNKFYEQHEAYYSQYAYESADGGRLYDFVLMHKEHCFLEVLECQVTDKEIIFIFVHDLDNANESNSISDTEAYIITYNRILDEFEKCEYEGS